MSQHYNKAIKTLTKNCAHLWEKHMFLIKVFIAEKTQVKKYAASGWAGKIKHTGGVW